MQHGLKTHLEIIAADTDIFSIFLLNHELFSNKQVVMIHGHGGGHRVTANVEIFKVPNFAFRVTAPVVRLNDGLHSETEIFGYSLNN